MRRDAVKTARHEAARKDKLKSKIENALKGDPNNFLTYLHDYLFGNGEELSKQDKMALEEIRKIHESFNVAPLEIAPTTEDPRKVALVQSLITLLGHVTEAGLMLDFYNSKAISSYHTNPVAAPTPPFVPAASHEIRTATKTTRTLSADESLASSTKSELTTRNEKIKKIFEEGFAEARKSVASRRLDDGLPEITEWQLGDEIDKLRTEHPGEKISLATALKDRFASTSLGKIILPERIIGVDFRNVDFSGISVYGVQFLHCDLSDAKLADQNYYTFFVGCNLDRSDLSRASGSIFIQSSFSRSSSCKSANFNGIKCLLSVYGSETDFKGATFEGATLTYTAEVDPSDTFLSAKNLNKAGISVIFDEGSSTEERQKIGADFIDDTTLSKDIRPYVKGSSFFRPPTRDCDESATIHRVISSDAACEELTLSSATSQSRGISPEIIKNFVTEVNKKIERYGLKFTDEDGCQDYATTLCEADLKTGTEGAANTIVHGRKNAFAIISGNLTRNPELSRHAERTILHELGHTLGLNHGFAGGAVSYSYRDAPPILSVMNYDYLAGKFPPIDSESLAISDHKIFETLWGQNPQYRPGDKVVQMEEGKTKIVRRDEGKIVEIVIDQKNSSYTYEEQDPSDFQHRYFLSGKMRMLNMRDKESDRIVGSVIVIDDEAKKNMAKNSDGRKLDAIAIALIAELAVIASLGAFIYYKKRRQGTAIVAPAQAVAGLATNHVAIDVADLPAVGDAAVAAATDTQGAETVDRPVAIDVAVTKNADGNVAGATADRLSPAAPSVSHAK